MMKIWRCFLYSTWHAPGLFVLVVTFMLSSGASAQSTRVFTESAFLGKAVPTTCTDCSASPVHIRFYDTQVSSSVLSFSLQIRVADLVGGEGNYLTNSSLYLSASPGGGLTDANGNLECSVTNAVVTTGSVSYESSTRQRVDGTLFTRIVSSSFTSIGSSVSTPSESFSPVSSSFQTIADVRCNVADTSLTANLGVDALSWDQSMRYSPSQSSINPSDPISQVSYVVVADNDLLRVELNGEAYAIDALVHSDRQGIDFSISTSVSVLVNDFLVFADAQGNALNIVESTATVSYDTTGRNVLRVRVNPGFVVDTRTVVSNGTSDKIIPLGDGQELGDFVFNGSAPYISTATFSSDNTRLTLIFSEGVSYISTGDLIFSLVASTTDGVSTATLQSITRNSSSEYTLSLSLKGAAPSSQQFFSATTPSVVAVGNEEINLRFMPFTVYDDTNNSAYQIQWATDRVLLQDTRAPSLSFTRDLGSEPHTLVVMSDDSEAITTRTNVFTSVGVPDCSSLPPPSSFNTTYISSSSISYQSNTPAGSYYCFRAEDTVGNIAFLSVELNSENVLPVISVVEVVPSTTDVLYTTSRTLSITAQDQQTGLADIGFRVSTAAATVCGQSSFTSLSGEFTSGSTELISVTYPWVTQTDVPLYICAFATDVSGNSLIASNNVVVVTNIDRDAPTIAITEPVQTPSSMATIMGSVSGDETRTAAVSGLASFGYTLLTTSSQVCGTSTAVGNAVNVLSSTNPSVTISTTKNGVRACFVAVDNAGNRSASLSEATRNIDSVAPVHQVVEVSSDNTVLRVTYVGINNIAFASGAVAANNYGISVDVLNPDSIRSAVISTVTVSGKVLRIEVRPSASSGDVVFSIDGVDDVLFGDNIARSRYGTESYQVTIPSNTIRDAVGNVTQAQEVSVVDLKENADPVLVTLGMRSRGSPVTVIDVFDTNATSASFTLSMIFSETITTKSIASSDFTVYRISTTASIMMVTTADGVETITFSPGESHTLALANLADVDGGSALSLKFSQIPLNTSDTSGYLVTYINKNVATGGCLASDAGSYPYSNAVNGNICLATSLVAAVERENDPPTISQVKITPTTTEVTYASMRSLQIIASDQSGISVVGFSQSTDSATACTGSSETLVFQQTSSTVVGTVVASRTFVQSTVDPVFVCAFAVDKALNRSTATAMIRVVSNIDANAPVISITGPTQNPSSRVTITGSISGIETTSSSVSGIGEFGFVEQLATAECTVDVTLATTLTDLVTSPNGILSFETRTNGVRLCFVATDNAGNVSVMPSKATTKIDVSAPKHSGVLTVSSENRLITIDYAEDGPTIHFTQQSSSNTNRGITLAIVDGDSVRGVEFAAPPRTTGSQLILEVDPLDTNGLFGGDFSVDGVVGVLLQTFSNDGSTTPTALSRAGVESYQVTIPANTIEDVHGTQDAVTTTTKGKLTANADPVLVTLGRRGTSGAVEEISGSVESSQGNIVSEFDIDMIFSETIVVTTSNVTFGDFRVYRFDDEVAFRNATINSAVATITPVSNQLSIAATTTSSDETWISLDFSGIPAPMGTVGYLIGFINDGVVASGGCYPNPQNGSYPYPNRVNNDTCLGTSSVVIGFEHIFNIRVFLGGAF